MSWFTTWVPLPNEVAGPGGCVGAGVVGGAVVVGASVVVGSSVVVLWATSSVVVVCWAAVSVSPWSSSGGVAAPMPIPMTQTTAKATQNRHDLTKAPQ